MSPKIVLDIGIGHLTNTGTILRGSSPCTAPNCENDMNRLRVLKQRAARGLCGVCKLANGEWFIGDGRGQGDCAGPFASYREAIQKAAHRALPYKRISMYINGIRVD